MLIKKQYFKRNTNKINNINEIQLFPLVSEQNFCPKLCFFTFAIYFLLLDDVTFLSVKL